MLKRELQSDLNKAFKGQEVGAMPCRGLLDSGPCLAQQTVNEIKIFDFDLNLIFVGLYYTT